LTADVVGAVFALASRSDIDAKQIGLIGASQAGWIAPRAALVAPRVAFVALASATPVTERQANLYERLAGGEQGQLSKGEIAKRLKDAGPSGFDPLPDLKQMTVPSLWLFGSEDDRVPVDESVAILDGLKSAGKDITMCFPAPAMACSTPRRRTPRPCRRWSSGFGSGSTDRARSYRLLRLRLLPPPAALVYEKHAGCRLTHDWRRGVFA
jgi:dienelactone hydrolase